ncbi:MAG: aminotransferase class III-fold pyridoxal phosphate-dependent enzyme, partial [Burkholderiales bacterium]
RERGYHGVGFGGISVGGIAGNRKHFGSMLAGVDHLPHTHDLARNAFSKGQPQWGAHLADELEKIVALHDPSTIAAVIVEPVAGSTGVLIPPVGYLQKLREITSKHGILLIFDEVITGFGRLGSPFASQHFGVIPDLVTVAKGITSGTVPMGAVFARRGIYDTFMQGPEKAIELFHGYTYSAHPLACAAAIATLDVYEDEGLLTRAATLAAQWQEAVHSLRDCPNVIDVRNIGLIGAIELAPRAGAPGTRAFDAFTRAFHEQDLLIRVTGDIIALSPPLIIEPAQIDEIVTKLRRVLTTLD